MNSFRGQHHPEAVAIGQFIVYEPSSNRPVTAVFEHRASAESAAEEMVRRHNKRFFIAELVSHAQWGTTPIKITRGER